MYKDPKQATVGRDYSRRDFIKASGVAVGALGALSASNHVLAKKLGPSGEAATGIRLNVSGYNFSRVADRWKG